MGVVVVLDLIIVVFVFVFVLVLAVDKEDATVSVEDVGFSFRVGDMGRDEDEVEEKTGLTNVELANGWKLSPKTIESSAEGSSTKDKELEDEDEDRFKRSSRSFLRRFISFSSSSSVSVPARTTTLVCIPEAHTTNLLRSIPVPGTKRLAAADTLPSAFFDPVEEEEPNQPLQESSEG